MMEIAVVVAYKNLKGGRADGNESVFHAFSLSLTCLLKLLEFRPSLAGCL